MEGTVAESDYENFAVFYICSKEGGNIQHFKFTL